MNMYKNRDNDERVQCKNIQNVCQIHTSENLLISEYFRDDECDDEVKITLNSNHESNKCRKRLKRVIHIVYLYAKPTSIIKCIQR